MKRPIFALALVALALPAAAQLAPNVRGLATRAPAGMKIDGDLAEWGIDYLMRQAICIGGGTTEMAMNVISERVLKMPRDATPDRDLPFRDVPRNRTSPG